MMGKKERKIRIARAIVREIDRAIAIVKVLKCSQYSESSSNQSNTQEHNKNYDTSITLKP